jgi:hypothetical protein
MKKRKVHKVGLTWRQMLHVRNAAHKEKQRLSDVVETAIAFGYSEPEDVKVQRKTIASLEIAIRKMTDVLTDAALRGDK